MTNKDKQNNQNKTSSFGKQKRINNPANKTSGNNYILDSKAKFDIIAIALIVLGVALFAVSLVPTEAPVSSFMVTAFKFIFGVGIYIFPFALVLLGISFFLRTQKQKIPIRVLIGLSLIFVAVLTIVSLTCPAVSANRPQELFNIEYIINYGGIIGSALAWLGVTLLGNIVSLIIMIGVIISGMIVIGLSITNIVEKINDHRKEINLQREEDSRNNQHKLLEAKGNLNEEQDQLKTQAINNNQGKKPGLKTRIMGFRKPKSDIPQFDFDPQQNKTKMLNPDKDNSNLKKKPAEDSKTKVMDSNKKEVQKSSEKPTKLSMATSTPKPMDGFKLPSFEILHKPEIKDESKQSNEVLKQTAENLKNTLEDFGIKVEVVGWVPGPTVTLFKVDLPAGVRVSRITALNDDIALALAAPGVRVFAPIPGTTYVGIEVPNQIRKTVYLSEVLNDAKKGPLQMAIGKDVEGNSIVTDLAKMPHLLIGGTTGSGKSVSINAMIMSILLRSTPSEVRMILIDPKRVEFTPYNDIPHLYVPVVTEPKEAASALSWGVAEMENRLKTFSQYKVRNIGSYNAMVQKMPDSKKEELDLAELPYIVIVIDELADLMMAVGKEVEFSISRIAQLARAAGIHLIVATQRPSTNVVTGLIKANITSRIAFNVASGIDSRVILDTGGAETLIGLGDLLFNKPEFSKPLRIQGCYVAEDEVSALVEHLKSQGSPEYHNDILKTNLISVDGSSANNYQNGSDDDSLFWEAAEMIVNAQHGSTSSLQRRFKIGYARAGRIMDMLEEKGIVGPQNGSKPREVLVDSVELEGIKVLESDVGDRPEYMDEIKIKSNNKDENNNKVEKIEEAESKENDVLDESTIDNRDHLSEIIEEEIDDDVSVDEIIGNKTKKINSNDLIEEDIE